MRWSIVHTDMGNNSGGMNEGEISRLGSQDCGVMAFVSISDTFRLFRKGSLFAFKSSF